MSRSEAPRIERAGDGGGPPARGSWLEGREAVFAGRLVGFSRRDAEAMVHARGGSCAARVTRRTDLLVLGLDGHRGGRPAALERARTLRRGSEFEVLSEDAFLERVGIAADEDGVRRWCTLFDLPRLLEVPLPRIRHWRRAGLLEPATVREGVELFDLRRLSEARALRRIAEGPGAVARLASSLDRLRSWQDTDTAPLDRLLPADGSDVLVRLDDGRLANSRGQLWFDFVGDAPRSEGEVLEGTRRFKTGAALVEEGLRREEEGRLEEAEAAYRDALRRDGPRPEVCLDLGNVLRRRGRPDAARERFEQAVELDPGFVDAWNNLGNVLAELGDLPAAIGAYEEALSRAPDFADAHFNIAEALFPLGRVEEARRHWERYVDAARPGPWTHHAHARLRQTLSPRG